MMVLLGEVGGEEEYKIVQALKDKRITKPLVAWSVLGKIIKIEDFWPNFSHFF